MLVANTRTIPNALEGVLRASTINQSNFRTVLDPEQRDTTVTVDSRTLG
jgi:hypothetical protein